MPDTFIGGRLRYYAHEWEKWTSDKSILETVSGLKIKFKTDVVPYYRRCLRFNEVESDIVAEQVNDLLAKGIIRKSVHEYGEVISNIFLRKKKDGVKYRMILNLKPLNKSVEYSHFKMDSLETAKSLVRKDCFVASVDLSDAYFCVPLHQDCIKMVKFEFRDELYEFVAMPQGLSSAPRVFTKLLKPVFATMREQGHTCMGYIDDSLIVGRTFDECKVATEKLVQGFTSLGFVVNQKKSVFTPVHEITFLGYVLNTENMTIRLPDDKVVHIIDSCSGLLQKPWIKLRELAQVIGLMNAYCNGVEHGKLHYRTLEKLKSAGLRTHRGKFDGEVELNDECKSDCQWWIENAKSNVKKICHGSPDIVIFTDASSGGLAKKGGWGAKIGPRSAKGRWSDAESYQHINVLETKAIYLGLRSLCGKDRNVHIQVKSDNKCAITYINDMGGMQSRECNEISKDVWQWAIERNIWVSAAYVPGTENVADEESRIFHDDTEWKLNVEVFRSLTDRWGTPEIDMFASRINFQIERYVSWGPDPFAAEIDAFTLNWSNKFIYANPPFSILGRTIQKLEMDQARAILVAPMWTTQPWFSLLMTLLVDDPIRLPGMKKLFHLPYNLSKEHPLRPKMMACLISGKLSECRAYQKRLSLLCSNRGDQVPKNNTKVISKDGKTIVMNGRLIKFVHL